MTRCIAPTVSPGAPLGKPPRGRRATIIPSEVQPEGRRRQVGSSPERLPSEERVYRGHRRPEPVVVRSTNDDVGPALRGEKLDEPLVHLVSNVFSLAGTVLDEGEVGQSHDVEVVTATVRDGRHSLGVVPDEASMPHVGQRGRRYHTSPGDWRDAPDHLRSRPGVSRCERTRRWTTPPPPVCAVGPPSTSAHTRARRRSDSERRAPGPALWFPKTPAPTTDTRRAEVGLGRWGQHAPVAGEVRPQVPPGDGEPDAGLVDCDMARSHQRRVLSAVGLRGEHQIGGTSQHLDGPTRPRLGPPGGRPPLRRR